MIILRRDFILHSIRLKTPAKINITLDINGVTSNGYHTLKMITQTISMFDYILIFKNDTGQIKIFSKGIKIPKNRENIMYKAVSEFFNYTNIPFDGITIKIEKNIPIEAGLGGGSSDAAATLIGLDKLFNTNLSTDQLQSIGLYLGADVPLFINNKSGTTLIEGIGEIFNSLPNFPDVYFILIKPFFGFCTKEIYKKYDEIKVCAHPNTDKVIAGIVTSNISEIASNMYNILEEAANNETIYKIKDDLISAGALGASMTGSGSAVFGIFQTKVKAKKAYKFLKNLYKNISIVQPVDHGSIIVNSFKNVGSCD